MGIIEIRGGEYNYANLMKKDKHYLVSQCLGLKKLLDKKKVALIDRIQVLEQTIQTNKEGHQEILERCQELEGGIREIQKYLNNLHYNKLGHDKDLIEIYKIIKRLFTPTPSIGEKEPLATLCEITSCHINNSMGSCLYGKNPETCVSIEARTSIGEKPETKTKQIPLYAIQGILECKECDTAEKKLQSIKDLIQAI